MAKYRPKAKIKLGESLRGETHGGRAQGYAIYSEYDAEDRRHYTWEEWEVTAFNDYDSFIEYDHYTRKITAYEPFKTKADLDPNHVKAGQTLEMTIDGKTEKLTVHEVGTAKVVRREGAFMHHVFVGEPLTYAEITYPGGVLSVEKYNEKEYDVYKGRVLSVKDQKKMFGKRLQPLNSGLIISMVAVFGFAGLILIPSFIPSYQTTCTPRSLVNSNASQQQGEVVSQDENQTCYRRAVYGGAGGLGK